ncbi:MAG TPA: asparaginase [Bacillota bacterium]|nr:asparaginase [Bacillota bacterium]
MSRLDILSTGGTIASRAKGPMASGEELVGDLRKVFPGVDIRVHDICSVGSSQITTHILWDIGTQVQKVFYEGSNGVVITHGTDTMEETAYFLDLMSGSTAKKGTEGETDDTSVYGQSIPIVSNVSDLDTKITFGPTVVTGAMRGFDDVGSEGMANLIDSCKVALQSRSAAYGVLVVMNSKIHLAREVTKVHSWMLDAFASPATGPVGYVNPQRVDFLVNPPARSFYEYTALVPPVDLLKTGIASDERMVKILVEAGSRGIVVESMGYGHLPKSMIVSLQDAVNANVPVVMTTRCLYGGAPAPGTLTDSGFITTDLNSQKARIKLMLALSITNDLGDIASIFAARP